MRTSCDTPAEDQLRKLILLAAVLSLCSLSLPCTAAGIGGGGGAGALSGLWDFFLTSIAPGLGIAAIAVVGILAMGARIGLILVCGIVIGIYVINHADAIYAMIAV